VGTTPLQTYDALERHVGNANLDYGVSFDLRFIDAVISAFAFVAKFVHAPHVRASWDYFKARTIEYFSRPQDPSINARRFRHGRSQNFLYPVSTQLRNFSLTRNDANL